MSQRDRVPPSRMRRAPPRGQTARLPTDLPTGLSATAQSVELHAVLHRDPDIAQPDSPRDRAAEAGLSGTPGALPHQEQIQASFAGVPLDAVQAYVGGEAAESARAIGARAFTSAGRIAFVQPPDLRTAAHEAAHVVQQRAGWAPAGGRGERGDVFERHADAVAERVVSGRSAADLLDRMPRSASPAVALQCLEDEGVEQLPDIQLITIARLDLKRREVGVELKQLLKQETLLKYDRDRASSPAESKKIEAALAEVRRKRDIARDRIDDLERVAGVLSQAGPISEAATVTDVAGFLRMVQVVLAGHIAVASDAVRRFLEGSLREARAGSPAPDSGDLAADLVALLEALAKAKSVNAAIGRILAHGL